MKENILLNKKVLVAEDNIINQMVVNHSLANLGAETAIVADGSAAIEKLKHEQYDLVLMDIQMPVMDGYATTRFIRNELQCNVPIIAMTAFALKGEDEKCFECGMNGYVSKPFTLESLYESIHHVFQSPHIVNAKPNVLSNDQAVIDISMLYEIAGNDEAYILTMISTFLENLPLTIAKIEAAQKQCDWDGLFRSAHYAKSSLSVIKVTEMYNWAATIEYNAKHRCELESIAELVAQLKQKARVVEHILTEKFGRRLKTELV